jgi:type VI secretion system secreted protein VgrG
MAESNQALNTLFGNFGQDRRLLKLDTSLGPNVLLPQRVHGHDRVSQAYDFSADLLSLDANIELKHLIAQEVTLWIRQADASYLPIHGYVHTAKKLGSDGRLTSYQIGFASCLHFLKFRKDARIWQDKDAEGIIADVLNGHPQCHGRFKFQLSRAARRNQYALNA